MAETPIFENPPIQDKEQKITKARDRISQLIKDGEIKIGEPLSAEELGIMLGLGENKKLLYEILINHPECRWRKIRQGGADQYKLVRIKKIDSAEVPKHKFHDDGLTPRENAIMNFLYQQRINDTIKYIPGDTITEPKETIRKKRRGKERFKGPEIPGLKAEFENLIKKCVKLGIIRKTTKNTYEFNIDPSELTSDEINFYDRLPNIRLNWPKGDDPILNTLKNLEKSQRIKVWIDNKDNEKYYQKIPKI